MLVRLRAKWKRRNGGLTRKAEVKRRSKGGLVLGKASINASASVHYVCVMRGTVFSVVRGREKISKVHPKSALATRENPLLGLAATSCTFAAPATEPVRFEIDRFASAEDYQ